jgi:hypothetical protein
MNPHTKLIFKTGQIRHIHAIALHVLFQQGFHTQLDDVSKIPGEFFSDKVDENFKVLTCRDPKLDQVQVSIF